MQAGTEDRHAEITCQDTRIGDIPGLGGVEQEQGSDEPKAVTPAQPGDPEAGD